MSNLPKENELLKLLLDETRLAILGLAAQRAYTVEEMAGLLPIKRAGLARHVAQLARAGLLTVEQTPAGPERYALAKAAIQRRKQALFARADDPTPETADEKVLASFVRNGRVQQIPVQQSKRLIVLAWLAERFLPARSYTEAEVNELLDGQGEDYASLRRYLVDYGFLARESGTYVRIEASPQALPAQPE